MRTVIKPMPDREGEGLMDSRVLRDARVAVGVTYPEDNENIRDEEIQRIRREVGAKNRDIVDGNVEIRTENIFIDNRHNVAVRIYKSQDFPSDCKSKAMLYIHGGGFLAGDLEMCDNLCKGIAKSTKVTVFSIEYSLAPEFKYPTQVNECFGVLKWIYENADILGIDKSKIILCGDSAGGNLSAVCALRDRDEKTEYVAGQILLYPALNIGKFELENYCWSEEYFVCKETDMDLEVQKKIIADVGIFDDLMQHVYVETKAELEDSYVCPILARDVSNLPKTILVVGEFDYLRPEIMYYGKKLDTAGVDVTYIQYQGINHGFAERLGTYPQAEDLMKIIVETVNSI